MGERKVLNKYIPADFDPQLVPKGKKPKDDLVTVRMMLPFSIQCSTCSTFLYRGRKFNSKKESVKGINGKYLGIQRYRFYIKCSSCSRPVTFLTDPKNADYEMESGGTRNYEVWHDESKTNAEFDKQVEEDEKLDSMKALENRVAESQREMAELDALEEIRAMNQRHVRLMRGSGKNKNTMDVAEAVLRAREAALGGGGGAIGVGDGDELNENGLTKEEEDLVSSIRFGKQEGNSSIAVDDTSGSSCIRRLNEEDELLDEKYRMEEAESLIAKHQNAADERKARGESDGGNRTILPVIKVKRKKINDAPTATVSETKRAKVNDKSPDVTADTKTVGDSGGGGGALDGLLGYGSDSD